MWLTLACALAALAGPSAATSVEFQWAWDTKWLAFLSGACATI